MKKIITKSGILIAAGLAICATAAAAPPTATLMRIDIPFSFLAGEKSMPAGIYWVRLDARSHTLDLTAANEGASRRLLVTDGHATRKESVASRGVLSFRRYGSTLVLKGVYAPGAMESHNLPPSKAEIELAKATVPATTGEATVDLPYR
ncbi:MAG: hypothetical protein P4L56_03010 [Candidatus Sulfopaludibacter sp.]|nr:hypothetical protein [Candidatus Sulfopaludibacter sp.]